MARAEMIEVRGVGPRADQAYRGFLVASLLLATFVGFILGIHVSLSRLLNAGHAARTADLVQAHGQAQLLGFAGLYVMGMSLRLLPRFSSARLAFQSLIPLVLWLVAAGVVLRAVVMPWTSGEAHDMLLLASLTCVLLAAACFLLIVAGTLMGARRADASAVAFLFGATILLAASELSLLGGIDAVENDNRGLPYLADNALTLLVLGGFVLVFIFGVALRALPAMVGLERPARGSRFLPATLGLSVSIFAASLLYQQYVSTSDALVVIADLAYLVFGVTLLVFIWQVGVLRPAAQRIRPSSQPHLWLVRTAFLWLVVAAGIAIYTAVASVTDLDLPTSFDFDAVRHALGVGVITSLILGMSLMILPEFAVERQRPNLQRQLALGLAVLVNIAAVLRVAPSVAGARWSADDRDLSMAVAGSVAEVALIVFAVYLLRLIWQTRNP